MGREIDQRLQVRRQLRGHLAPQLRVRIGPSIEAVAVDTETGRFDTWRPALRRRTRLGVPDRHRLELGRGARADPGWLAEKMAAPSVEHGLSTVGYDDEGVAGQQWDLVKNGVLVDRWMAKVNEDVLGTNRSNGCAYADSAGHIPIQRMANVSLQPAPDARPPRS